MYVLCWLYWPSSGQQVTPKALAACLLCVGCSAQSCCQGFTPVAPRLPCGASESIARAPCMCRQFRYTDACWGPTLQPAPANLTLPRYQSRPTTQQARLHVAPQECTGACGRTLCLCMPCEAAASRHLREITTFQRVSGACRPCGNNHAGVTGNKEEEISPSCRSACHLRDTCRPRRLQHIHRWSMLQHTGQGCVPT
jgi:hypothetical protein